MVQPVRINHAGALIAEDTRVFEETGHLHPDSMCPDSSSEEVLIFQLKSLWEEVITWLFFFFPSVFAWEEPGSIMAGDTGWIAQVRGECSRASKPDTGIWE